MTTLAICLLASALAGVSLAALRLWRTCQTYCRTIGERTCELDVLYGDLHEERRVLTQCETCRPQLVAILARRRAEHAAAVALAAPRAAA